MAVSMQAPTVGLEERVADYPLLDALIHRRSRRFGKGMTLDGGPLAYASQEGLQPVTLEEEAALSFAACGVTGHILAELPYQPGNLPESGSGNIMAQFIGRTTASADALHTVIVFVINDDGVWMIKRPQDFPRGELNGLIQMGRDHKLVELYEKSRVRIASGRLDVPRELPFVPTFNKWSANVPGTTYFLPVHELTALCINVVLTALNEEFGYYILDERNSLKPAGLAKFARSKGGHLYDDPAKARVGTVGSIETWMCEFAAIEAGGILQNLGLMGQALGLGGFPHFAAHPFVWFQTLGFRMEQPTLSRVLGLSSILKGLLTALRKDIPVPTGVGLEHEGVSLIKPYCPPYYRNMEEAVLAFVDLKYAEAKGTLRDGGATTAFRDGAQMQAGMPAYSDKAIAATIAYCDYIYQRYGRFPMTNGPFRTVLAYQAHRLDMGFYDRFYRPDALSERQRAAESGQSSL